MKKTWRENWAGTEKKTTFENLLKMRETFMLADFSSLYRNPDSWKMYYKGLK